MSEKDAAAPDSGETGPRHPIDFSRVCFARNRRASSRRSPVGSASLDLAEESVAEAIEEAVRQWRTRGVPPNPGGWLTQAARHNALDRIRREKRYREKLALLTEPEAVAPEHGGPSPMNDFRCSSDAATPRSRPMRNSR